MKKAIFLLSFIVLTISLFAQKKTTTSAIVTFDATTSLDNLPRAENKTVIAAIDIETGSVQFEAAVKNFAFANPSMQGHFNGTKWMNSDEFPKFTFNGAIIDPSKTNLTKDGTYNVSVTGDLTVKNITKQITVPVAITVKEGILNATTDFTINLSDYEITGAPVDAGKVSPKPRITVSAGFK